MLIKQNVNKTKCYTKYYSYQLLNYQGANTAFRIEFKIINECTYK